MFGFRRKTFGYGLQILDHQIKLAAVSGVSGRMNIHKTHTAALPEGVIKDGRIIDEDHLVLTLRMMAKQLGIEGKEITLTIPTSNIILRRSTFMSLKDNELRNLIDVELHGGGSQLPFKNPVFDFVRIGKSGGNDDVIIFASPTDVIENYVHVAKRAGLVPTAVDLAPLALFRVLCKYMKSTGDSLPSSFMILNAESEVVEISIYIDGFPVFFRSIPVHAHAFLDDDTDYLEAYGKYFSIELGRVMNYYKYSVASEQQEEIKALYLVGDAHFTSGLAPSLGNEFAGEIRTIQIDTFLHTRETDLLSYAVPIGLAMKGA